MAKRMLVDASHPEETRVVVLDGNKVEEFDYESASRRPLKGNIYLAKVTRVEPSLQACFVEYGGNRHGFLAFSEIHPDYYQIPVADRQALLEASRAATRRAAEAEDDDEPTQALPADDASTSTGSDANAGDTHAHEASSGADPAEETPDAEAGVVEVVAPETDDVWVHDPEDGAEPSADTGSQPAMAAETSPDAATAVTEHATHAEVAATEEDADNEQSEDDEAEELPRREHRSFRRYKIQEVIKRRQVLLVQVVKEERGNKGAALTTYLSLAGRYCVLMPNTDRGGGISRKISNVADRRKLKEMASEFEVPEGMGVIIRTAGANRTRQEIRRDFEYLLRQWDAVRELTLRSSAPTLVYEEGNLVKRTIRDLYSKDVEEVLVEGEQGFAEAHGFMTMLMPSHADSVKHYRDTVPMFQRYGVETALDSMFNPTVRLRSGGYIVINQTEALVAVDVNSGKATREHHIEDTALKTNLEAAEEIARQLRLRDLAGLVVIDFIDMEEHRNNRSVEKRLKDCLRHDRARIQLGRISPFGLLEMSRQRLRAGMIEGATITCPHCEGRGVIRSVGSMALRVLRAVEEFCQREKVQAATLRVPPEIAIYILNHKRAQLSAIEDRNGVYIYIESRNSLAASAYEIERGSAVPFEPRRPVRAAVTVESELESNDDDALEDEDIVREAPEGDNIEEVEDAGPTASSNGSDSPDGRRRRRRRRGRGRDRDAGPRTPSPAGSPGEPPMPPAMDLADEAGEDAASGDDEEEGADTDVQAGGVPPQGREGDEGGRRRRRRGRRGRRGRREGGAPQQDGQPMASPIGHLPTPADALDAPEWPHTGGIDTTPGMTPAARWEDRPAAAPPPPPSIQPEPKPERSSIASFFGFGPKPDAARPAEPARQAEPVKAAEPAPVMPQPRPPVIEAKPVDSDQPKRKGWWQKRTDA